MLSSHSVQKVLALLINLGLGLQWAPPVLAVDTFADNWQARPLIDNTIKPQAASKGIKPETAKASASQMDLAILEAQLKPAEPFIASIEKNLLLSPKKGALLTERLSTLQTVLYGEPKYQDAGKLLAELATVFPAEAAKAHSDLTTKLQPSTAQNTKPVTPDSSTVQPTTQTPPAFASHSQSGFGNLSVAPYPKQKKRFWNKSNDPFANDPFFQDQPNPPVAYPNQQSGPSTLGAIGQGLAGLAMMASSVAGSYYLNRNSGKTGLLPQNGYYNNPYANSGYPNGYAPTAYGLLPGQVPYVYNQPYLSRPTPGYGGLTTQVYQPYGNAAQSISPLGAPTGFRPY
jgi:hypothetical protein